MRTRLSVCRRKVRYADLASAMAVALAAGIELRTYRCDRCFHYHLTSRTKGKRSLPRAFAAGQGGAPPEA